MSRITRNAQRAARAFSLVEVLIAVLILALGLLGLGAVFPVIVREQKLGNDIIVGTLAGNSARALLQGMDMVGASGNPNLWSDVRDALMGNSPETNVPYAEGAWLPGEIDAGGRPHGLLTFLTPTDGNFEIPVKQRLYPLDAPSAQPQFVWDLAVQRVPDGDTFIYNDDLRIASVVRRIDGRIRTTSGTSLFRALADRQNVPQSGWRVPVAEDADGVPTYDGLGGDTPRYSEIRTMEVEFDYNPSGTPNQRRRDRFYVSSSVANTVEWRLARQPNQKLIDNLGNVYTVLEYSSDNNDDFIRVSPEVPAYVTDGDQIREVAFTPQVAAAIVTWSVTP